MPEPASHNHGFNFVGRGDPFAKQKGLQDVQKDTFPVPVRRPKLKFVAIATITSVMASRGSEQGARRFDRVCRVLFPAMIAAVFVLSFLA